MKKFIIAALLLPNLMFASAVAVQKQGPVTPFQLTGTIKVTVPNVSLRDLSGVNVDNSGNIIFDYNMNDPVQINVSWVTGSGGLSVCGCTYNISTTGTSEKYNTVITPSEGSCQNSTAKPVCAIVGASHSDSPDFTPNLQVYLK